MTKAEYGLPYKAPVVQSADFLMSNALKHPGVLIQTIPWHFILPWLDSPKTAITRFWRAYESEEALAGRTVAIYGPKFSNRQQEQILIGVVAEYQALSIQHLGPVPGKDVPPSLLNEVNLSEIQRIEMLQQLKERMVDWVLDAVWNDAEAPKRLHELLKSKKTAKSEYGDQPTSNARIFNAFVREVSENWKLPTKKAVRLLADLGDDSIGRATAAVAFKTLGLSGLPEG
jgi:hypothetical protein